MCQAYSCVFILFDFLCLVFFLCRLGERATSPNLEGLALCKNGFGWLTGGWVGMNQGILVQVLPEHGPGVSSILASQGCAGRTAMSEGMVQRSPG